MTQVMDQDECEDSMQVDELLKDFQPEESLIDRMLLYQITGKELDECMLNWRRDQ